MIDDSPIRESEDLHPDSNCDSQNRRNRSQAATPFRFEIEAIDPATKARAGRWLTPHGEVLTPLFMPVGTLASVKGIWPHQLEEVGVQQVLANTYHLALRPGSHIVRQAGGLHHFMNWKGPILTDSGGFQVFSLSQLKTIDDDKVVFRSHIDGSLFELTPERAVCLQEDLGADCIMCLDECPPHDVGEHRMQQAVDRTTLWAERCRKGQRRDDQALFGILQGGTDPSLRKRSAQGLLPLDFPGYAVGGLSVGETPEDMYHTLDFTTPMLPEDRPRYLMGVGRPIDIIEGVLRGIDFFDCVMPTRNGRNAMAFTSTGPKKLRNKQYQANQNQLDDKCTCPTCTQFSLSYIRHLFTSKEMMGPILLSLHNIAHYQQLVKDLRTAIVAGESLEFRSAYLASTSMKL